MKTSTIRRSSIPLLALGILSLGNISVPAAEYHSLKEIPVGGAGGFDYLTVDSLARRLYVSHGTKVVVIDLEKEAVVGEIADTPEFTASLSRRSLSAASPAMAGKPRPASLIREP
jgi:hypothetical protein